MFACPLATVLYRFDDPARFPVFESHTTAKGPIAVRLERDDDGAFLQIAYQRPSAEAGEVAIALALPIVAVDGRPRQLLLDVLGDASRCGLQLEGMDYSGGIFAVSFGTVDFEGWRTLRADSSKLVSPAQFHRLHLITIPNSPIRLGLRSLSLTGDVRLVPPGIAHGGRR